MVRTQVSMIRQETNKFFLTISIQALKTNGQSLIMDSVQYYVYDITEKKPLSADELRHVSIDYRLLSLIER